MTNIGCKGNEVSQTRPDLRRASIGLSDNSYEFGHFPPHESTIHSSNLPERRKPATTTGEETVRPQKQTPATHGEDSTGSRKAEGGPPPKENVHGRKHRKRRKKKQRKESFTRRGRTDGGANRTRRPEAETTVVCSYREKVIERR
ncbi:Uncharacterized protein Rs2_19110 [Raphanus sativus]|nr:Uncharacterized protein Rs2_19110 [Raphanus sativus]